MPIDPLLRHLGLRQDPGAWILPGRLLVRNYPRRTRDLHDLAMQGITVLINLHERAHDRARLATFGLTEVHIPVRDFTAPTPAQIDAGVAAIDEQLAPGGAVAIHCGGGLGRSGTLAACYLVHQSMDAQAAIAEVRRLRPGAIETDAQVAAVEEYARQSHNR